MERGKQVIGLLLILVSIGALVTWEKWGKNRFLYDEVLVLNQNVEKGTVITEAMVEKRHMDVSERDCIGAEELQAVVGREAAFFVHKNVPLFPAYFAPAGLTPDASRDRYVLSVPSGWLAAAPRSLSKGDRAYFYCGGKEITSALTVSTDLENGCIEVMVSSRQAAALSSLTEAGQKLVVIYN